MRSLRISFWALVLSPLLAGGVGYAQAPDGWETAKSGVTPPQAAPPVPRPVPVQVTPLASPASGGWAAAPSAGPQAASTSPAGASASGAPPALRAASATEAVAAPAPLVPAPAPVSATPAAPVASAALTPVSAAPPAPVATAPVMRAPLGKIYGPQRLSFADGVGAQFDVTYQTLPGFRPLTLDLYQPQPRGYPLPLVVFVHGGTDTRHAATIEDFPAALAALAAQGYVIASVNYRLSGEAAFPAALRDVKSAIRWLRARGGEYNIDTTRIAVWGASGGGQLAALAGVACGVPLFAPAGDASAPSDCVQGVISWYGATDIRALSGTKTSGAGFTPVPATSPQQSIVQGCDPASCPPSQARIASPMSYISVTSPPFLIVQGGSDTKVPPDQAQKFHEALRAKNVPSELVIFPGVGHDLARDGAADPAVNRQALEKVAAFLSRTFPPGPIGQKVAGPRGRGPLY